MKEGLEGKVRLFWGEWGVGKWRVMNGMVGEEKVKRGEMWRGDKKGMERRRL